MLHADYEEQCLLDENFSNVVIIDNIPIVTKASGKIPRLNKVLKKTIQANWGKIILEKEGDSEYDGLYIPTIMKDDKEVTAGYCMVEFEDAEGAKKAVTTGQNFKLGKKNLLQLYHFTDYQKYTSLPDTFVEPKKAEYVKKANLTSWLLDRHFRDQFVVRYASETEVYWNDPIREVGNDGRILQYGGERQKRNKKTWTDGQVEWSPNGNFLVTYHLRGIALWGGGDFEKLGRFSHSEVKVIAFSPKENYLITCNGKAQEKEGDPPCLAVWDVNNSCILRPFGKQINPADWPVFHWSHDDKYLARVQTLESSKKSDSKKKKDVISVYELPDMNLLDKRSIDMTGVREVLWSPSDNYLSYWVPERNNIPARVGLLELPSKKTLRDMHIYSVENITMYWQNAGDYLCIQIQRKKTRKNPKATNFEIVRMRSKSYPVEVLEISSNVIAFTWEPDGDRFAVIHGDGNRPDVSFWSLKNRKLTLIKTLKEKLCNTLYWKGNTIILGGLGTLNGALTFVETTTFDVLNEAEHFMCNDVEWDPSGRYCITSVVADLGYGADFRYTMENGYKVWNAQGQMVSHVRYTSGQSMYRVAWRPRPKSLLTKKQISEIKKKLKEKYWRKFEKEDQAVNQRALSDEERNRFDMKTSWKQYREKMKQQYRMEAPLREKLRGGIKSDDETTWEEVEEDIEEEIECAVKDG